MKALTATWTNGQILPDEPANWPEGCRLRIEPFEPSQTLGIRDDEWSNTPEAIEAWIRWYESLEPLEFTPEEQAAWDKAREDDKRIEWRQRESISKNIEVPLS